TDRQSFPGDADRRRGAYPRAHRRRTELTGRLARLDRGDCRGLRTALGLALPKDELTQVARLYATTGDGFARITKAGDMWTVELYFPASGMQCLAVAPSDPDTVFVGLREGGVRRSVDGGRSWIDCELPEPAVFSLAVSAADGAVYAGTE